MTSRHETALVRDLASSDLLAARALPLSKFGISLALGGRAAHAGAAPFRLLHDWCGLNAGPSAHWPTNFGASD